MKRIVIEVDDFIYEALKEDVDCGTVNLNHAVVNGIVLPKEHGDLIDRSELIRVLETEIMYTEDTKRRATLNYVLGVLVFSVPTLIKADDEVN